MSLLSHYHRVYNQAKENGGVKPIRSTVYTHYHNEVPITVRVAHKEDIYRNCISEILASKQALIYDQTCSIKPSQFKCVDPFRPYDKRIHLLHIEPKYELLLNKFPALPYHLTLITEKYEPQTDHLKREDFAAIRYCFKHLETPSQPWLMYYNCAAFSGASQPHKHMQFVRMLDNLRRDIFPLAKVFDKLVDLGYIRYNEFKFEHLFISLKDVDFHREDIVDTIYTMYKKGLEELGLLEGGRVECEDQISVICDFGDKKEEHVYSLSVAKYPPYNFIFTKKWMLIIPRRLENYEGVSVSALHFLFHFFPKGEEEYQKIKEIGFMKLLEKVTLPRK